MARALLVAAAQLLALLDLPTAPHCAAASPPSSPPIQRGVALGLFSEDEGWSYRPLLDEIAKTGADHVELVVAWYLEDVRATEVREHPRYTAPLPAVERAIKDAHSAGLRVFLFPILRLEKQANPNEWRGTLRPRDKSVLFASYTRAMLRLAKLAERTHVELLSVGSELSTLDVDRPAWEPLVRAVRNVYHGPLTYSGNWDHYSKVAIYDLLDYVGMCGYFKLSETTDKIINVETLAAKWRALRDELLGFAGKLGRPLLFTEIGYLSQRGASSWPWNEGATEPVDLEDQRRCYEAFRRVWAEVRDPRKFGGVYFWNWYGWGGANSGGYTPRGKPAVEEMKGFFGAVVGR